MKSILIFAALILLASARVSLKMVNYINSNQSSWTASLNSPTAGLTHEEVRGLLGVNLQKALADPRNPPLRVYSKEDNLKAPETFDPRTNWPTCESMSKIRDQSKCGSCWAFGAVESISDRECIVNKENWEASAEDMNSCSNAGDCDGGYPGSAMSYWQSAGVVSEKCRPYSLPGCDHHIPGSTNPCPEEEYPTPDCVQQCVNGASWATDKRKAAKVYTVSGENNMKTELSTNGPCEGAFTVYEDFLAYTGGVYHHVTGSYDGGHAIKVLGYGVDDSGNKYWLCANSWNEHWGEKGYFRIKRGTNECGIESTIWCGVPQTK